MGEVTNIRRHSQYRTEDEDHRGRSDRHPVYNGQDRLSSPHGRSYMYRNGRQDDTGREYRRIEPTYRIRSRSSSPDSRPIDLYRDRSITPPRSAEHRYSITAQSKHAPPSFPYCSMLLTTIGS